MKTPHLSHRTIRALSLATVVAISASARADVKLPTLFSDHMVLQQENADPVWGTASPNEEVTVKVGDKSASATAGPDGKWMERGGESPRDNYLRPDPGRRLRLTRLG
jgi:hypothetical protein